MPLLKLTAFGMRGSSAAAKFLLVIYVASTADSILMGQVAIVTTLTTLFTQVAGLEINQVVGRRLHRLNAEDLTNTLRGQIALSLCAYIVLVPITFFVYPKLLLPHWIVVGLILILEHFITEVYRLNILLLRPIFASGLLFIKNTSWVLLFIGLTVSGTVKPTFFLLIYCWSAILLLLSIPLLAMAWKHQLRHKGAGTLAALRFAPSLVREAIPFIASSVLMAGVVATDKLIVGKAFPASDLGVYFFFTTCASILTLVVTFSVGSTIGPASIKTHSTQGNDAFQAMLPQIKRKYWTTILATSTAIVAIAWPLFRVFKKDAYANEYSMLVYLVVSAAFASLCDPYKLNEYVAKRDKSLVIGNSFQMICLLLAVSAGSFFSKIHLVAAGVMASSIMTFFFYFVGGPRRLEKFIRLRHWAKLE